MTDLAPWSATYWHLCRVSETFAPEMDAKNGLSTKYWTKTLICVFGGSEFGRPKENLGVRLYGATVALTEGGVNVASGSASAGVHGLAGSTRTAPYPASGVASGDDTWGRLVGGAMGFGRGAWGDTWGRLVGEAVDFRRGA